MWFTKVFYQHIMFRHSCGNCHYCNTQRPSDITIADFWGWQKTDANINKDDKGVSLVLVNTEKGRKLWEAVKHDLDVIPAKLDDCLQHNLQHPSIIHRERMKFERDYINKGFTYVYDKTYHEENYSTRLFKYAKRIFKGILRRLHIIR